MRFAPEGIITQVKNSYSDGSETVALFTKVEKKIKSFFRDTVLLFSPSDFEASLTGELDKFRGLEGKLVKQINPSLAAELVADIRLNYKRRTNLMTMLKRFRIVNIIHLTGCFGFQLHFPLSAIHVIFFEFLCVKSALFQDQ